ncbi:MAG: GNAT family N-acetyltransferase [Planctomycetes bacterium]|nr:GNAT family N-acetyltransferase [Planctomycetota bacterium]
MARVRIEAIGPEDWERYRTIRLEALRTDPDAFGSTFEREATRPEHDWRKRLEASDARTFVAIEAADSSFVGLVTCAPYAGHPRHIGLFSMWVTPAMRGRGIGGALVRELIAWARTLPEIDGVVLEVADENLAAVKLYESMGFRPNGVRGSLPPPRDHVLEHQRVHTFAPGGA